jgi:hypothetical protein
MRRLAVLCAAAVAFAAYAQVLYKWTDEQGRTQYSDRAPKGFAGKVERIEPPERVDVVAPPAAASPAPVPPPARPAAPPEARKAVEPVDIGKRRRETRERLEAAVAAAESRLEEAKAKQAAGEPLQDDERQTIQQMAGKRGSLPAAKRSNCRSVTGADGKAAVMCPAVIPNEAYYDRMRGLEEAVKQAEIQLDLAKDAYRRGVD